MYHHSHFQRLRARRNPRYDGRAGGRLPLLRAGFFPAAVLYHELLLLAFDQGSGFFTPALVRIFLFSLAAGLAIFLLLDVLPWRRAARGLGWALLSLGTVILCVARGCRSTFGVYYSLGFIGGMAGDVAGNFASSVWTAFVDLIPFLLLALLPLLAYGLLHASIVPENGPSGPVRVVAATALVVCQLVAFLLSSLGGAKSYYTYDFTANTAIPQFGLVTSLRLEVEYALLGTPQPPLPGLEPGPAASLSPSSGEGEASQPSSPTPAAYGYNVLDIDFDALASAAGDETIRSLHRYFGGLDPSQKNDYTGMFRGKNLILITAEAFSPYVISPELTPTLYQLSHEGFVFDNFYQPDWTQSTSGGEFAVMTGLIPNWFHSGSQTAFQASVGKEMPISLARQFAKLGYQTPAWHNHQYTYYGRAETHPNLGYDYQGVGNGLELAHLTWPNSDLEMMQSTVDSYIRRYVDDGTPFHAYYMTVSGHGAYSWADNAMSVKHKAEIQAAYPDAPEAVQAYLACNLELEAAMAYLVGRLEQAGIADDTLIVLTSDHYPYLLAQGDQDYYNQLRGFSDREGDTSRYRNTLIMWSASIQEPVEVHVPCSAVDIVPTLCNLFGLDYDSRLYSGRDVFAENYQADQASTCMPLVVFANTGFGNSWITAAGTYEASTGAFTPNPGVTVEEGYVSAVSRLAQAKYAYAKQIIQQDYYRILEDSGAPL